MMRLIIVIAASTTACLPFGEEQDGVDRDCDAPSEMPSGVKIKGRDPMEFLSPLFGSWTDDLVWEEGGSSDLTFTVTRDPEEPIYRTSCANPDGVYTYADGTLVTDDGRLNESLVVTPVIVFANEYAEQSSTLSATAVPERSWQGTFRDYLSIDFERYTDSLLVFDVTTDPSDYQPAMGSLSFMGTLTVADMTDKILLGTVHFQR